MYANYPDAFPGESETDYENRKMEESQAAMGLMFGIASLLFFALKMCAIFGIYFYAGFILSQNLLGEETRQTRILGLALLFTYVIFCIIYFFKGTVIGLRAKSRKLWILPWAFCVMICCIIPAIVVKAVVSSMFDYGEQQGAFYFGLTWGAFILCSLYMYGIYQFKTHAAPRILYWSYALGLRVSL
ncbi:hypothetical protein [Flavobacterium limi]|uniref:hypothetical protein n=1 Tax=Flavobacterium limi TaxID=2045105 RepID=UPI0013D46B8F|nr:hypothetical protein [Flavobacterium limi]